MLHSSTVDPFKLALYKLIGKLEPTRRSVAQVTTTTEDWLWFQLAMLDEEENGGLGVLTEVLLGYGERHFDGPPGHPSSRRGVWAGVLLMCGQFERVCHSFVLCGCGGWNLMVFLNRLSRPCGIIPRLRLRLFIWLLPLHTMGC